MAILPVQPAFREVLRHLDIVVRDRTGGLQRGERTTNRKGQGLEFADHRPYAPGDDPRSLDWAALGRMGRPVVKEYLEESDLAVTVFVDASASMGLGAPSRFDYACTLAWVLAAVAVAGHNRAGLGIVGPAGVSFIPPRRGQGQLDHIEKALRTAVPGGTTALATGLARHFSAFRCEGVAVVISDLYDAGGHEKALDCLVQVGARAWVVLVTDREEIDLAPVGAVEFVDSETGEVLRSLVTPESRQRVARAILDWRKAAAAYGVDRGLAVVEAEVHRPVEEYVAELARRGQVVH